VIVLLIVDAIVSIGRSMRPKCGSERARRLDVQLRILGTRGNIDVSAPGYVKHYGILVDDRLLLDAGEKEYLDYRPRWIFITHEHSDHMALKSADIPKRVSIYAPETSHSIPTARIVSSKPVIAGRYTVTPVPTVHSQC
jgi:hypothetical protein